MTIWFVTKICCSRVLREAYCLKKRGWDVRLLTRNLPFSAYGIFKSDEIVRWWDEETLERVLKSSQADGDLYHVHNEPSWPVSMVKRITGKPVVFDVHDLWYGLTGEKRDDEQQAFDDADGVIHVSGQYGAPANEAYGYAGRWCVVRSFIPRAWMREPKRGHGLVYEGGALAPRQLREHPALAHRDLTDIIRSAMKRYPVTMYIPQNQDGRTFYRLLGAETPSPTDFFALLGRLTGFEWGLSVFPRGTHVDASDPSKMQDYLAAGLPVIGTEGTAFGRFVKDEGIGVTVVPGEDFILPDSAPYKARVLEVRERLAMEMEIHKVEELYAEILH